MLPSLFLWIRRRRWVPLRRVTAGGILATLVLAGCSGFADLLTPGTRGGVPLARVTVAASIASSLGAGTDVASLKVVSQYLRRDGSAERIGVQLVPLTAATTQQVQLAIDLATCLADPDREADAGNGRSCSVVLNLALTVNGTVVDEQMVGPLRLTPGATTPVSQPVALYEITAVDVEAAGRALGPSDALSVLIGERVTLAATIRDRNGTAVPARSVTWTSDAPAVATIGVASGQVTAVGPGTARFTASVEGVAVSRTVTMHVTRPPVMLSIGSGIGSGAGVVRSSPAGIECRITTGTASGTCLSPFTVGTTVVLSFAPDAGTTFEGWSDDCATTGVTPTCTLTMDRARSAAARTTAMRRLTVGALQGDGRGRVTSDVGIDCRVDGASVTGRCTVNVPDGTSAQLTITADDAGTATAHVFGGWGGDCAATTGSTCTVTLAGGDRAASARFIGPQVLRMTLAGNGAGEVRADSVVVCTRAAGTITETCSIRRSFGRMVRLTAVPMAGASFAGWSGDCEHRAGTECITTLTASRAVTAVFNRARTTLTLILTGARKSAGRIDVNGEQACAFTPGESSVTCTLSFDTGTPLTVTAVPATGSRFLGFIQGCAGTEACQLLLSSATSRVWATFEPVQYRLSLTMSGPGAGSTTLNGAPFCTLARGSSPVTCTTLVDHGETVVLGGGPSAGATMSGLDGDCAQTNPCTLVVTRDVKAGATFDNTREKLTVALLGPGTGSVTVAGTISCSRAKWTTTGKCEDVFVYGTVVTLTATAVAPSWHVRWAGACAGQTGPVCKIAVTKTTKVVTGFDRPK